MFKIRIFKLKKQPTPVVISKEETLETDEIQTIQGGRRGRVANIRFKGSVRNGSPNSSVLNRLAGKRLG